MYFGSIGLTSPPTFYIVIHETPGLSAVGPEECLSVQFVRNFAACLTLAVCTSLPSVGQQSTAGAGSDTSAQSQGSAKPSASHQSTTPQPSAEDNKDKKTQTSGQGKVAGTSNDRLFYALPNFLTLENTAKLPPMSAKDKYKVIALGTFDYVEYPWWAILAAISQASDGSPSLGQGWKAYAQRYGITAGDSMVENFMVGAVYPSILHQDPRFYQSGKGGFNRRLGYSISRIFVTRTDSGKSQFNYSEIFGAGTAAAISTYTYHPRSHYISTPSNPHQFEPSDRTFNNMIDTWGTQLDLDTITIVVKEFWPDVHRKLSKKHHEGAVDSALPTVPAPPK